MVGFCTLRIYQYNFQQLFFDSWIANYQKIIDIIENSTTK